MAGETSAELTIVVRAQDAATRVITGIGKSVGRILTAPLRGVVKAVGDITKQFFGLKGVLVGGGIIAAVRGLTDGLSTSERKFKAVFSADMQARINAVDDAFGRLGASIKSVFGYAVAKLDIDKMLNGMSDWIRDNKDLIVSTIRSIIAGIRDLAAAIKQFASGNLGLGDLFGTNAFGIPMINPNASQNLQKAIFNAEYARLNREAQLPPITQDVASRNYEAFQKQFIAASSSLNGGEGSDAWASIVGSGPIQLQAVADTMAKITQNWTQNMDAVGRVATDAALALSEGRNSLTAAMRSAADEVEAFKASESGATPIVEEVTAAVKEQSVAAQAVAVEVEKVAEVIKGYLTVAEAADLFASNMTDAFYDMVTGAESVGRAFGRMVQTIIGELGKLLLYRSLLNLLTSLGTSLFGGASASGGGGGAFTSESGFGGLTSTAFAAGGKVRRHTFARVGENGPENVLLPAGSSVEPAHRSRGGDGGGSVVNVYGARDPKATALEVMAQMRLRPALRAALR